MKVLTLTTIGTLAAVLAFSTGCSQDEIHELNTKLDHVHRHLDDAKEAQKDAEREMNVAQDQSETAYVNLHNAQKALKTQRQRADRHEAASQGLKTKYDLKVAEYETFLAKTAEALAAKDKRISELETQLSAVRNKD